jgi:Flp pilus assembly protein TadD
MKSDSQEPPQKVLASIDSLLVRRRFRQAEAKAMKWTIMSPRTIGLLFQMFDALFGQARYAEAEAYARRILRLSPNEGNARLNVGASLQMQGKTRHALRYYRLELKLNPDCIEAHYNLGITLAKQHQWQRALPHLKCCIGRREYATDEELELLTAQSAFKSGDRETESMIYQRVLKKNPSDTWAMTNKAALFMDGGDFKLARKLLVKAQQLVPSDPIIARHLAKCHNQDSAKR